MAKRPWKCAQCGNVNGAKAIECECGLFLRPEKKYSVDFYDDGEFIPE